MTLKADTLSLDILETDPETPGEGDLWYSDTNGFGPKATQTDPGFMSLTDKTKLDNMSANGSGDDWVSGLLVEAQPSPDQTVKYAAGVFMVNGVLYEIESGGNYDLTSHYAALASGQRAVVLVYTDSSETIKSVVGTPTSSQDPPLPAIPNDSVCLSFVVIRKHTNGSLKNITPSDVTDVRASRKPKLDELAKVSATDTTSGFLKDKLSDNGNVHFTKENADANETLKADVQFGSSATTACVGNDSRLSDARTPTAHASSHQSGGGDAIKLDDLSAPDDNTDLDASTSKHGLLPKLGGGTTNFLRADGTWNTPSVNPTANIATATATTTTSSATYTELGSMSITPAAGNYAVWFSSSISHTTKGTDTFLSLFSGGSQVVASESSYTPGGVDYRSPVSCLAKVTVNGSQAIEIRWKTNAGTASCYGRSLMIMKVT